MPLLGLIALKGWAKLYLGQGFKWHYFRDGAAVCDPLIRRKTDILMPVPLGRDVCAACNKVIHPPFIPKRGGSLIIPQIGRRQWR